MRKNQIVSWLVLIAFVVLGIFVYVYGGKAQIPQVGEDGKINGEWSMAGVMRLGKPYVCNFNKSEGSSRVSGIMRTDGKSVYGEFRIISEIVKNEFRSFLLVRGGDSYIWTSLEPTTGYKTKTADSASSNASPQEQAQIVGLRDNFDYKCEPWQNPDQTVFDIPSWINFIDLKK